MFDVSKDIFTKCKFVIILALLIYYFNIVSPSTKIQFTYPSIQTILVEDLEASIRPYIKDADYVFSLQAGHTSMANKLTRPDKGMEWQQPTPSKGAELVISQNFPYPGSGGQQPEREEVNKPELYGIIIIGDSKKYAIMQGWKRGEDKQRTKKIRLGNGQIKEVPLPPIPGKVEKENVGSYKVGDYISEAQIVEILPEKVIMEQTDGIRYELELRDASKLEKWMPDEEVENMPGNLPALKAGQEKQFPESPDGRPSPKGVGVPDSRGVAPGQPVPAPVPIPSQGYVLNGRGTPVQKGNNIATQTQMRQYRPQQNRKVPYTPYQSNPLMSGRVFSGQSRR